MKPPRGEALGMNGVDEQRLARFERLLVERAIPLGLISAGDADVVRARHVDDSLRALECLPSTPTAIMDLGSGAGLPGVPLAIARPDCHVVLVEPMARRVAFLELVLESLSLANARVVAARAEELHESAQVVVSRAWSSAPDLWGTARGLLRPGGYVLYFAGASWGAGQVDALRAAGARCEECGGKAAPGRGPLVIISPGSPTADAGGQ